MGSPFRNVRRDTYSLSSSPGLPSLDQINSQVPRRPPIRSGSAAMPVPDNFGHRFTSASSFLRQEQQHPIDLTTPSKSVPVPETEPEPEPELSELPPEEDVMVISLAMVKRPKRKKLLEKKFNQPPPPKTPNRPKPNDEGDTAVFKDYIKTKGAVQKLDKKGKATKAKTAAKPSRKKAETVSRHFAKLKDKEKTEEAESKVAPPKKNQDEPLVLEAATRRRIDWTPPPETGADVSPESARVVDLLSSNAKSSSLMASKETFDNLLKNYGRAEEEMMRPTVEPTEASNQVFRKRKLIEAVSINDDVSEPAAAAATKTKAPRKKPRTITELATAAYAVPDATEEAIPAPPLESVEDEGEPTKGKRKRASKAKKPKKMPPPEPVLLSPTAALRQAARQDYIFGTSSQLAREQSPTFLRDLQTALRASNSRLEDEPFATPINSDAIEPESRNKLWAVGARDEDGRVLDLEVINLADTPEAVTRTSEDANPFGYVPAEKENGRETKQLATHFRSEDSFPDIDDLLAQETIDLSRAQKEVSPFFSTAQPVSASASTAAPVAKAAPKQMTPVEEELNSDEPGSLDGEEIDLPPPRPLVMQNPTPASTGSSAQVAQKPNFGLFTDTQLAREISSYGFKPVKRRQAMLALLDQCWASRQRTALSSLSTNRPVSTASQPSATAKLQASAAIVPPKRGRGRPRKNSTVELSSSEPPPSAQPLAPSPKPLRGRPRKTEATITITSITMEEAAAQWAASMSSIRETALTAAAPTAAAKGKAKEVIEIPDSASEGFVSPSPPSSPEISFSSPPPEDLSPEDVSMSVSVGEDTEISLAAAPTSTPPAALFEYITKAVTTAPPATDPKQPSFHEMMLMYDPIVLEDFAMWLNTGQLSRVGYDGEVSAAEAKQCIVLLSPTNQVLLLHRVKTSTSFASAHVFPGGNLDSFHEGDPPPADAKERHEDSPAYRLGAIRECFEETGILLATKKGSGDASTLVNLSVSDRDAARKQIHGNQVRFSDWVENIGGVPDVDALIPFTRWITPTMKHQNRFTTQMYIYMLPFSASTGAEAEEHEIIVPTPDGGVEHTAAKFDTAYTWLERADAGHIILFPPQYYLLHLVSLFCSGGSDVNELAAQRDRLRTFLATVPTAESESARKHHTSQIAWADKVMSPHNLFTRQEGKTAHVVLGIDKPGPELKDSGRGGDWERVILVNFTKEGPRQVRVRNREDVLREKREADKIDGTSGKSNL
ncbi:Structure-specific endonuclease subunit SLX4 [Colletotrichum sidae]|uniref:Structure-specific endonuclease subunit SLX4 n=1 Tax=Colletotrichum sidae TaxID=1347389 RepID=A0A4R8T800_9PEZI|nr:Structure-specific endonuclease subunit SLX4 [Colletotrichum sidae]